MSKHGNNKKKVNNPDPMSNAKTMAREGMRIIQSIAHGTYNIFENGHIFRNPEFVNATIMEVDKRLYDATLHLNAMTYAYGSSTESGVLNLIIRDQKKVEAYNLIRELLVCIVTTGDTGFLYTMASKLPKYKYNI